MIAFSLLACAAMVALLGVFLLVNSILVFNSVQYMAAAPGPLWRDPEYVRRLPNFLKQLRDAGFISPWPKRPTAFAAYAFRRRLHQLLKADFPGADQFIQRHLSLWAFVQLHREELQHAVRRRQMTRARQFLSESLDANLRIRMVLFLNQCRKQEFIAAGTTPPPAVADQPIGWLVRLRSFDILLREHGYQISDELSALVRWEDADDAAVLNSSQFI